MVISLNPSTVNEDSDDPTIRRVKKCNNPLMLADWYLQLYAKKSEKIIFAWGNFKECKERAKEVLQIFSGYMLIKNKDGSPRHPLYVPGNIEPVAV